MEDHEDMMNDTETHDVSPYRQILRKKAAENVQKKADSVKATVLKKSPSLVFKLGDVVLIPLDDVDRTKVDGANLVGVVVLMSKLKSTCRVAVKHEVLKRAYVYHVLRPVPKASNNLDSLTSTIWGSPYRNGNRHRKVDLLPITIWISPQ